MIRVLATLFSLLLLNISFAAEPISVYGINNIYKINTKMGVIYSSSQPSLESLPELKKLGIKTYLNLRTPNELMQLSEQHVKMYKLQYFNIPVQLGSFSFKQINKFHQILANKINYPIFIHCSTANRVAMMIAFNDIYFKQLPYQQAIQQAKEQGLTSNAIQTFIETFVKKYPPKALGEQF